MNKTFDAVYVGGSLRPVEPVEGLQENDRVVVTISSPKRPHPLDGWVGGLSEQEAEEMMRIIEDEFEKVDPNEWK